MSHELYSDAQRRLFLAVLFLISTCRMVDNYIITILLEPIKAEFSLSDTQLGMLSGFAFVLCYATLGIPIARIADRGNRRTVICVCFAIWSAMTGLFGMAQSFVQLLLVRAGVGAGEAGSVAPSQSLIVDYYAPEKRAGAIAVFTFSNTVGALLAYVVGAQLAAAYGWRATMLVVGLPGLAAAVLARIFIQEPRQVLGWPTHQAQRGGDFRSALRRLAAKRSYRCMVLGIALFAFADGGIAVFFPSFMIRSLGISMAEAGTGYGLVSTGAALVATIGGGWLANRAAARSVKWLIWLPAIGIAAAFPCYAAAFLCGSYKGFLAFVFVAGVLLGTSLPAAFTAIHAVCGSARRAVAIAVTYFVLSLIGTGLGPLVTGAVSDAYAISFGPTGLTYALVTTSSVLLLAAWALYLAGQSIDRDVEA